MYIICTHVHVYICIYYIPIYVYIIVIKQPQGTTFSIIQGARLWDEIGAFIMKIGFM